jgi:transglutaminase-like putative cysteine protease
MKFNVFSELEYQVLMPSTFIFNIQLARTPMQSVLEEFIRIDPYYPYEEFKSQDGKTRFIRLQVKDPVTFKISYSATVDCYYRIIDERQILHNGSVEKLEADVIPYLFPSRYCQSDKLQKLAYKEFGKIDNQYLKVLAINEWIYHNVEYVTGSTNSGTSALDTLTERTGVCRDFAHLGIALCRALSIPARYFTGYSYQLFPQDFHACFEAYIGGNWLIFDPTMLVPLNGLIKIANGRDAADASVASIFGDIFCTMIQVNCTCIDNGFQYYDYQANKNKEVMSFQ